MPGAHIFGLVPSKLSKSLLYSMSEINLYYVIYDEKRIKYACIIILNKQIKF